MIIPVHLYGVYSPLCAVIPDIYEVTRRIVSGDMLGTCLDQA